MAEDLFRSGGNITDINIREEMKKSFIDYAMSVIVSRALPDVRDGLKPVHRRILYAMHDMGMYSDKPFKKCARIVGEVLGKYHPHGDTAVYDTLVRLAQSFSSRYALIDGHGNFGTLDDGPAAMRYTEARLDKISADVISDIDYETVDFQDNFDGSLKEPIVLPSRIPGLLINGSTGIAVGMATNIPPHNLTEVMNGVIAYIENPEIQVKDMMKIIKGPDFPSGCTILGRQGIEDAYTTGKGSVTQKGSFTIEELGRSKSTSMAIVITELPYLVGPEMFITKVAELVRAEKLTGLADANDESNREGMRIVLKLKRDANPQVVLNNILKYTQLQQNFSINTVALVKGKPRQLNLLTILNEFVEFRVEVITRKAQFDLRKAEERDHILQGLLIALDDIDAVIALIKKAKSTEDAREGLVKKFKLTEIQANAILEMQLRRLTGLEREKIENEHKGLLKLIKELTKLLGSRKMMLEVIKQQSQEIIEKYGDERKTKINAKGSNESLSAEDLIADEKMAVFITRQNYIKRIPLITFERQRRATRGKGGIKTRDEDDLQHFFVTSMHDTLLFFTDRGVVYSAKVYDVVEGSRQHKGQALVNLIPLKANETVTAVIPARDFSDGIYLNMLTLDGTIKKTTLSEFEQVRKSGIIAINLDKGDSLGWVRISDGSKTFILGTADGMVIRYSEDEVRSMGRAAKGVKAITMREGDKLVGFDIVDSSEEINLLLVTNDGFGKRVKISEFRVQGRGGLGLIGTKFKTSKSKLAAIRAVTQKEEFMIATSNGVIVRQKVNDIPHQGRMATGVRVQNIDEGDVVVSVNPMVNPDDDEDVMRESDRQEAAVAAGGTQQELPLDDEPVEEFE